MANKLSLSSVGKGVTLKKYQHEEVERIYSLYKEYREINEHNEYVISGGQCIQGDIQTYGAAAPKTNSTPETVGKKAEQLQTLYPKHKWAYASLFSLDVIERCLVTVAIDLKKKRNPDTGNIFTMRELGLIHNLRVDGYKQAREIACLRMLVYAKNNPHSQF